MKITAREKNSLLLLLAATLAFGLYYYVIDPFLTEQQAIAEAVKTETRQLEQNNLIFKRAERLRQRASFLRNKIDSFNKKLLKGDKPPVAAAELQRLLKRVARKQKLKIIREKIMDPVKKGNYLQISIQITFKGTATRLTRILHEIEYQQPFFLMVPKLQIKVENPRKPVKIEATVEVSGFIKSAAG
ncbi:MAG: type II secretion system protein GspM [bacterium]